MKRLSIILIFLSFRLAAFSKEYKVHGPQGGLAMWEYAKCFGIMKLGREYIISTQELGI